MVSLESLNKQNIAKKFHTMRCAKCMQAVPNPNQREKLRGVNQKYVLQFLDLS